MKSISIEVDEETAKKWDAASQETRAVTVQKLSQILKHALGQNQDELVHLLDKVQKEAALNGLTPAVFQEIMELDNETMKNLFGEDFRSN